jgi:hypothetical protein
MAGPRYDLVPPKGGIQLPPPAAPVVAKPSVQPPPLRGYGWPALAIASLILCCIGAWPAVPTLFILAAIRRWLIRPLA